MKKAICLAVLFYGLSLSRSYAIIYFAAVQDAYTGSAVTSVCLGQSVRLDGYVEYCTPSWYEGTTLLGGLGVVVTPTTAGVHTYTLRCGSDSRNVTLTVTSTSAPSPPTITSNMGVCSGGPITLTAVGCSHTVKWYKSTGGSYSSAGADGSTLTVSTLPSVNTSFLAVCTDGSCTSAGSNIIVIGSGGVVPPPPSITASAPDVCYGKTVTLTATGTTGTVNWYKTTSASTSLGTGNSIAVTPTSSTVVSQYFSRQTVGSCTSNASNVVSVSAVAPAAITGVAADENFVVSAVNAITLTTGDCKVIAEFTTSDPAGGEIYGSTVNAKVSFDATVQAYLGRPYVQRHYDFHPVNPYSSGYAPYYSPIMYFTQAEFDAFNAVSSVKLPTGPSDNAGVARLRILHAYGTPNSLPATPGNYSGPVIEDCNACQNVYWIAELNAWQVRINTRGFSGFFITAENAALPVTLAEFSAQPDEMAINLHWKTVAETNFSHYEIQRSAHPGNGFENVGTLKNQGSATGGTYTFRDDQVSPGNWYYYRLRMVDRDGSFDYSRIIASRLGQEVGIKVFPNPAHTELTFTSAERVIEYQFINSSGQLIQQKAGLLTDRQTVTLPSLPAGTYLLRLQTESRRTEIRHVVIQ